MSTSIKVVAESGTLTSLPTAYIFHTEDDRGLSSPTVSVPVIDFSLLLGNPDQRSKAVADLAQACEEWGFFIVINHGISVELMRSMIEACRGFFYDLTEDDKSEFRGEHVMDPIRCGTSFNLSIDKSLLWRDFLKVFVHPEFHSPTKPPSFNQISKEYCKQINGMTRKLLQAVSQSLGLEPSYIDEAMGLDLGFQILIANLYPPCPQPDLAMGLPAHSDHGLLTVLLQNGVDGLQLLHKGKWVNVKAIPNSFLVNTADQLEVLSNGRYKSVIHRAVVNDKATRISLAVANGPALETVVTPAPEFVKTNPPAYVGIKYKDFIKLQQSNQLDNKSCLDRVRISAS